MRRAPAFTYRDGTQAEVGDLVLIGSRPGVWKIVRLGYYEASPPDAQIQHPERKYASLVSTRGPVRRTAFDVSDLRFCARGAL